MMWTSRREAASRTEDDGPYPRLARYLGIRGQITIEADINPQGQVVRAKVTRRDVEVPGVRNARPFAHEGVLDLATIAKAKELDWSAAAPTQGLRTVQREFAWRLN